jgi:CubicO group peptidase (beta-lactamase class C family)
MRYTVGLVLTLAASVAAAQGAADERIARVERGLLPRAVPKGQVGRHFSVTERIAYHGVPSMSIAVVDDGRIAWARAYGVRDRADADPVTTSTLFRTCGRR